MDDPTSSDAPDPGTTTVTERSLPATLFTAWRGLISSIAKLFVQLASSARSLARSWTRQWLAVREYHRTSALPWESTDARIRETAAAVGVRAFVFGAILAGLVTAATRGLVLPAVVTVAGEVLWAAIRFIIIALLMPRGAIGRAGLSIAFLAGLLPYALGATWLLRAVSLLLSAVLTHRGLVGAGLRARDTRLAIGWSFGGQIAVIAGGWLARALIAIVASS